MKTILGKVVSTKMQKTVVVEIERLQKHVLYKKFVRKTNKLKAHNEIEEVKTGDTVQISQVKPISKEKFYKVVKLIKKL